MSRANFVKRKVRTPIMADLNELDLNVPAAPSLTLDAAPAAPTLTLDPEADA